MSTEPLPRRYLAYNLMVYKGVLAWVQGEDVRASSEEEAQAIAEDTGPSSIAAVFEANGTDTLDLLTAQRAFAPHPWLTRVRS